MILHRLAVKNFRKYRRAEIELPPGLVGVIGHNGAGKTTLLEAVAFALYGSQASRTGAKGVRRDGCGPGEPCEVELELTLNGEHYRIRRAVRGAGEIQHAEMQGTGLQRVEGALEVTAQVRRLLGMDYPTFTRSVFSKQKEVNALSDDRPEERRRVIRRLVGIETVTRARDAAGQERRQREAAVEGKRRAIEMLPEHEAKAKEVRAALQPAKAAARGAAASARVASRACEKAAASLAARDRQRTADAELEQQRSGFDGARRGAAQSRERLEREVAALAEARAALAKLLPEEREFRRVQAVKQRLDRALGASAERERREAEVAQQRAAVTAAAAEVVAARAQVAAQRGATAAERTAQTAQRQAAAELARLQQARGEVQRRLGNAQAQQARADAAVAELRQLGPAGRCPTCARALGDSFTDIVGHLEEERVAAAAAGAAALAAVQAVDAQIRDATARVAASEQAAKEAAVAARAALRAVEKLTAARAAHTQARVALQERVQRLRQLRRVSYDAEQHRDADAAYARRARVHDRVLGLRQNVSRAPAVARELAAAQREVARLERAIDATERRRRKLGFDAAAYLAAQAASTAAATADKAAALALAQAEAEVRALDRELEQCRREIARLRAVQAEIAADEAAIRDLVRIHALLDEFRADLTQRVRPQIEEHASTLLEQVTEGRYPRIVLDEDYGIHIHDGAEAHPIGRFSGGEEDLANLCLRIAISQVVAQRAGGTASSLIVLDEIFGSQDEQRRERILQALGRLQESFQQVILVTHLEGIHDRVPNVLRVAENAAGEAEAGWL